MASRVVLQDEFLTLSVHREQEKGRNGQLLLKRNATQGDADAITGRIVVQIGNVRLQSLVWPCASCSRVVAATRVLPWPKRHKA